MQALRLCASAYSVVSATPEPHSLRVDVVRR